MRANDYIFRVKYKGENLQAKLVVKYTEHKTISFT